MPRAFSSGAASIWSYAFASPPYFFDSTCVIAAVSVVLPWSTCPIVPTFTCGLVRSNLPFAISVPRLFTCNYLVPMAWIEHATSPLPRECSTTELHGLNATWAKQNYSPAPCTTLLCSALFTANYVDTCASSTSASNQLRDGAGEGNRT